MAKIVFSTQTLLTVWEKLVPDIREQNLGPHAFRMCRFSIQMRRSVP